ncbi:MAG: UPF0175 family protein [Acidobacteriota bacterium]
MSQITLTIPDETLVALHSTPDSFGSELGLAAAVNLFELGRLSSGVAAKLASIPRTDFLMKLSDYGVATLAQAETELRRELGNS